MNLDREVNRNVIGIPQGNPGRNPGGNQSGNPGDNSGNQPTNDVSKCVYTCNQNGSCQVAIQTTKLFSGNSMGSCFSPAFGGRCSGTPRMCQECLPKCQGKRGQQFSENVNF